MIIHILIILSILKISVYARTCDSGSGFPCWSDVDDVQPTSCYANCTDFPDVLYGDRYKLVKRDVLGQDACDGDWEPITDADECLVVAREFVDNITGRTRETRIYTNNAGYPANCLWYDYGWQTDTTGQQLDRWYFNKVTTTTGGKCVSRYSGGCLCKKKPLCEPGNYMSSGNQCTECEAGYYGDGYDGYDGCQSCQPGFHQSQYGKDHCEECFAGYYSATNGESECQSCPSGYESNSNYTACEANTFCSTGEKISGIECVPCDDNTYQNETDHQQSECKQCSPVCEEGTYETVGCSTELNRICTTCPSGYYQNTTDQTSCKLCKDECGHTELEETTCSTTTNRVCSSCAGGQYLSDGGCLECSAGYFSEDAAISCEECSAGYYSATNGESDCTSCPNGYESNSNYIACELNTVCNEGQKISGIDCVSCDDNTYQNETDHQQSECKQCSPVCEEGTYETVGCSTELNRICNTCPSGYYQNTTDQTSCKLCKDECGHTELEETTCSTTTNRVCSSCTGGQYLSDGGCLECSAGYFSEDAAISCEECSAGYYSATNGESECQSCDAGYFSATNGTIECQSCDAGKFSQNEAIECTECPAGFYQSLMGKDHCDQCLGGTYTDSTGYTECIGCPPGKFSLDRIQCEPCAPGSYSGASSSLCSWCEAGKFSEANSDYCSSCETGKYSGDGAGECSPCEAGKFSATPSTVECSQCPKGYHQTFEDKDHCDQCQPGTFSASAGATGCSSCPAGYALQMSGHDHCDICVAGYYQDSTGSTECKTCDAGTFSDTGANTCTTCPVGYAAGVNGQDYCDICGNGYYQNSTGSTFCKSCIPGTFNNAIGASICSDCPVGYASTGTGNTGCNTCSVNYYQDSTGSTSCKSCAYGYFSGSGAAECITCNGGFTFNGVCANCAANANGCGLITSGICNYGFEYTATEPAESISYPQFGSNGRYCTTYIYTSRSSSRNRSQTETACTDYNGCEGFIYSTYGYSYLCGGPINANGGSSSWKVYKKSSSYATPAANAFIGNCEACGSEFSNGLNCITCPTGTFLEQTLNSNSWIGPEKTGKFTQTNAQRTCTGQFDTKSTCSSAHRQELIEQCGRHCYGLGATVRGFSVGISNGDCYCSEETTEDNLDSDSNFISFDLEMNGNCQDCPEGTYQDLTNRYSCKDCPANTEGCGQASIGNCIERFEFNELKTECIRDGCVDGQRFDGGACYDCSAGQFSNDGKHCKVCPTGFYGNSIKQSECEACDSGKFNDVEEATECQDCPLGQFSDGGSSVECQDCSNGQYQDTLGQFTCIACAKGKYSNAGEGQISEDVCEECPEGQYQDTDGQTGCIQCIAGKYSISGTGQILEDTCISCAGGKYSISGAGQNSEDVCEECPVAKFSADEGQTSADTCKQCPAGQYQDTIGQTTCKTCDPGTFVNALQTDCISCLRHSYYENGICVKCTNSYGTKDGTKDSEEEPCQTLLADYTVTLEDNTRLSLEFEAVNVERIVITFGDTPQNSDEPNIYDCDCEDSCKHGLNRTVPDMSENNFLDQTGFIYIACVEKQLPIFLPVEMPIAYRLAFTPGVNDFTELSCAAAQDVLNIHTVLTGNVCKSVEGDRYIRSVSPMICENVNGVQPNTHGCKCGNTACLPNQYCFAKYSTCQNSSITYVPTTEMVSGGCAGENEQPIITLPKCSQAAQAIGILDEQASQWTQTTESPDNCFYDHSNAGSHLWFNPDGTSSVLGYLDVLLCSYKRCSCPGGIPTSGCVNPGEIKCNECYTGYWLDKTDFNPDGNDGICTPVVDCLPGKEPKSQFSSSQECVDCPIGKYSAFANNAECVAYSQCIPGQEPIGGSSTSDVSCMYCQGNTFSSDGKKCHPITECIGNQEEIKPPSSTSNRICALPVECSETEYNSNGECKSLSICSGEEYQSKAPTETSDRECTLLTQCTNAEYETAPSTETSDRECTLLTQCTQFEHVSVSATAISDQQCETNICVCPHGTPLVACTTHQGQGCQACPEKYGYDDITGECELCQIPMEINEANNLSPCTATESCPKGTFYVSPSKFGDITLNVDIVETSTGNKYEIDGHVQRTLEFKRGRTYIFDSVHPDHPLRFSEVSDGVHGDGETYSNYAIIGNQVKIVIGEDTPAILYYWCRDHPGMGGKIYVIDQSNAEMCIDCRQGSYQPNDSHYQIHCIPHSECLQNTFRSVAGTTEKDVECSPLTVCDEDEYQSKAPTETSDRECTDVTVCSGINVEFVAPTPTSDRECAPPTPCEQGEYLDEILSECFPLTLCNNTLQYQSVAPTPTSDRECFFYTMCDPGDGYESKSPTPTSDRECFIYYVCDGDEYETVAPTLTSDRICSPLTECSDTEYITKNSTETSNRECAPIATCSDTEYEAKPPILNKGTPSFTDYLGIPAMYISNRICASITECTDQQYESQAPTSTSNRICISITECTDQQYESQAPTLTSNRICSPLTECSSEEYEFRAPSSLADRECSPLTECSSEEYESSPPENGIYLRDRICLEITECEHSHYNVGKYPNGTTRCELKECTCSNGQGTTGIQCDNHEDHICQQCDSNYFVNILRKCQVYTDCSDNEFESKAPTPTSDRECVPIIECSANQYENQAPTSTSNRECSTITFCSSDEYESQAPTSTSDRECTLLAVCASNQYIDVSASMAGDTVCKNITVCSELEYQINAPGTTMDRGCLLLTQCSNLEYQSTEPTNTTNRGCTLLTVCNSTQYEPGGPRDVYENDRICAGISTCGEDKYKVGEDESGDICETKVCVCPNGVHTEGSDCPEHGSWSCLSCDDAYYLKNRICHLATVCLGWQHTIKEKEPTKDRVCGNNICQCEYGFPEAPCLTHENTKCINCGDGYYLNDEKCLPWTICDNGYHPVNGTSKKDVKCETNICKCDSGNPATGIECPQNGADKCGYCPLGTYLAPSGTKCMPFRCTCPKGVPATGQYCTSISERCAECKGIFTLVGTECIDCRCENGIQTDTCSADGPHCASCNFGYSLKDGLCVKNNCLCENGRAPTYCNEGEKKCETCYTHYELVNSTCEVTNVRGDITLSIFMQGQPLNNSQVQILIAESTGFKITVQKSHSSSKGYTYELMAKDNPQKSTGAFKTLKNTIEDMDQFELSRIRTSSSSSSDSGSSSNTLIIILSIIAVIVTIAGVSIYFCTKKHARKGFKKVPTSEV